MTNEEIQRTMDFILGQQAQIAASFQRQEEERKRDGARIKRLEEAFQLVAQLAQATETRLERLETIQFKSRRSHGGVSRRSSSCG